MNRMMAITLPSPIDQNRICDFHSKKRNPRIFRKPSSERKTSGMLSSPATRTMSTTGTWLAAFEIFGAMNRLLKGSVQEK